MEYLRDLTHQETQSPAKRPQWVNDIRLGNFGVASDGKIKLRDYGQLRLGFFLRNFLPVDFNF